ncbi:MAG: hypothetical protein R2939_05000 [Kofleriaceae bacterium]
MAAAAVVAGACDKPPKELAGFGPWHVAKTTVGKVTGGRCDPTTFEDGRKGVWCYALPPVRMGRRPGQVNLYFSDGSATADAVGSAANLASPLVELQLVVRGCDVVDLDRFLRDHLGPPRESGAGRAFWENHYMLVATLLPDRDGSCLVRAFPLAERAAYDAVKAAPPPGADPR